MTRDDDALVDDLRVALTPADTQPPDDRVVTLRAQVAAASPVSPARARPRRRVMSIVAVAAAIVVAFAIGGVLAGNPPRPVRAFAHTIGLPVQSPELVDAYDELDRLGRALEADDLDAAEAADTAMLEHVARLDADEKREIVPVAHEVHQRYLEHLSQQYEP